MADKNTKTILAVIAGAAIGAGLALLLAPASGKETRDKISKKMKEAKDDLSEKGKELLNKVKDKPQSKDKKMT